MVPFARRRFAALALLLLLTAGVALGAVALAGGDDTPDVPEGGSSFGDRGRTVEGQTLLDALAPLLAAGTATPAQLPPAVREEEHPSSDRAKGEGRVPAQQLAQLFMVGFRGKRADDPFFSRLALRRWGAVIVDGTNYTDPSQLEALTAQAASTLRAVGARPPLIAVDQGGGDDSTLRGLPPAGQRTIRSRAAARAEALRASRRLRSLGVRMSLAPSADIGYGGAAWDGRAFSDDPAQVARRAGGAIKGWRTGGVAPAVGHYPGEGAASQDPSNGPATVGLGLEELRGADLRAFDGLLRTAPALLLSNAVYAAYDGVTPATLLPEVPALARRAGFRGVVVSGNLAVTVLATGGSIADAAVDALKAGCDLLWIPGDAGDQEAAYRAVVRAVRRGDIPEQRVRSALAHVTALKRKYVGE